MSEHPEDALLLPEGSRLIHIGPQKTGTTALQVALHRNRDELRRHGVVFPGSGTRPRKSVWSLIGTPDGTPKPSIKHWHRLVDEVREAGDQRVCISTEDLARLDLNLAQQIVDGLGGERAHVIGTVRRLDRLLPSQWQQRIRMRRISLSYEEWLQLVLGEPSDDPIWRNMWVPHDVESLVERWTKAVGSPERFTLIVADESDRTLIPRTFERLLGLPEGMLSLPPDEVLNSSLGIGRTEMIRLLTAAYESRDWPTDPRLRLRVRITNTIKAAAPWPDEAKIPPLPAWAAERVAEISAERAEIVSRLSVRVIGDPANLLAPATPAAPATPPSAAPATPAGASTPGADTPIMVSAELAARVTEEAISWVFDADERHAQDQREIARLRTQLASSRKNLRKRGGVGGVGGVPARDLIGEVGRRGLRRVRRRR